MTSPEFIYMMKKMSTFVKSALLQNICNTNLKDVCIENKIEDKKNGSFRFKSIQNASFVSRSH